MKKIILIFFLLNFNAEAQNTIKKNIINNLKKTKNLSFNFEQNINGKIETGNCIIEYPKKIYCKYNKKNKKILVSDGKSVVIKANDGTYYRYRINKTPLNFILDKNFIINEITNLTERIIDNKFVNFTIEKNDYEINIFFDIKNFDIIGWQTIDVYQNLNITFLSSIMKNQKIKKNTFQIPLFN